MNTNTFKFDSYFSNVSIFNFPIIKSTIKTSDRSCPDLSEGGCDCGVARGHARVFLELKVQNTTVTHLDGASGPWL